MGTYWRMPWQTQGEFYLLIALVAVGLCAAVLLGLFLWQRRKGRRLHERLDHLSTALTLLSDTMEASLHDVVRELARLSSQGPAATPPKTRAATQRRVKTAVTMGHSLSDIAAAEEMSEGEIALMLQMSLENAIERANHADVR